jgi:tripartite-type tricarboxylate transporter receptor subunit TctC
MMASFAPKLLLVAACAIVALGTTAGAGRADTVEDFYRGRQIRLIIGSNSGGTYDSNGRLLATHLGRHTPGRLSVVPSNMPGASGTMKASNFSTACAINTACRPAISQGARTGAIRGQ